VLLEGMIDPEVEKEKIRKELQHARGFLFGVEKKLSNERFVNSAPEAVVQKERQKKADVLAKIQALEAQLGK